MLTISAPGKLVFSGEWSVLEGKPCIIFALDKKVTVDITETKNTKDIILHAPDFNIKNVSAQFTGTQLSLTASEEQKQILSLVAKATETTLKYLDNSHISLKGFTLTTHSEDTAVILKGERVKLGFGSSAAVVVATIGAILTLHGIGISTQEEKERVFKLGVISHYFAQGKIGSSFDVAVSTFGGVTLYTKPDMNFVMNELKTKNVFDTVEQKWPFFSAGTVTVPKNLNLSIGFVGNSASTKVLVKSVLEYGAKNPSEYKPLIDAIGKVTTKLVNALNKNDEKKIFSLIQENRKLLTTLSTKSGQPLETPLLATLANLVDANGGAGKFSGAGGGDCGIGISFDPASKKAIETAWKKAGISVVHAQRYPYGVRKE